MPFRIVKTPVQVFRDGKFLTIEPSEQPVEFSVEEVKSIGDVNTDALAKIVATDEKTTAPTVVEKKA